LAGRCTSLAGPEFRDFVHGSAISSAADDWHVHKGAGIDRLLATLS